MAANVGGIGGIWQELISPTKTPKVPNAPHVDPQQAQRTSISGNLAALPGLEQLGRGVDTYNLAQRRGAVDSSIPGFENLLSKGSSNMSDWLSGNISPDVAATVSRSSNARAIEGGYGGSPAASNLQDRDLGLTSLGLQQGATAALPGYLSTLTNLLVPKAFDVQSGMLTPGQQISADQWNEEYRYKQEALVNELAALPDPLMAAVGEAVGSNFNQDTGAARSFFTGGIGSSQEGGSAGGGGGQSAFGGGGGGSGMSSLMNIWGGMGGGASAGGGGFSGAGSLM